MSELADRLEEIREFVSTTDCHCFALDAAGVFPESLAYHDKHCPLWLTLQRIDSLEKALRAEKPSEPSSHNYREALKEIRDSPHQTGDLVGQYGIGVQDGHRCAASMARAALADDE